MIIVSPITPVVVDWILFLVTSVFVFCRVYIQTTYFQVFDKGDYALVFAYILFLSIIIQDVVVYRTGTFNPGIQFNKDELPDFEKFIPDLRLLSRALKVLYSSNALLYVALYFIKAAFLTLYVKLFPPAMKRLRVALVFTTGFTFVGLIATLGVNLLWCQPVNRNWILTPSRRCLAYSNIIPYFLTVIFHLLSDIFIYILPFCLLPSLIHRNGQRSLYGVIVIFSLGFLCILSTVARLICVGMATSLPLFSTLASLELGVALIVACCPSIKSGWELRFYPHGQFATPPRTAQRIIADSPENYDGHAQSEQPEQSVKKDKMIQEQEIYLVQIPPSVRSTTANAQVVDEYKDAAPHAMLEDDIGDLSVDIPDQGLMREQDIGGLAPRERKASFPISFSPPVKVSDTDRDTVKVQSSEESTTHSPQGECKLSTVSRKLSLSSRHKDSVSEKASGAVKSADRVGLSTFGDVETVL